MPVASAASVWPARTLPIADADDLAIERRLEEDEGDQRRGERADGAADRRAAPGSRTRTAPGSAAPCASPSRRRPPARRRATWRERRISASPKPSTRPPAVATATSRALSAMPSARNGHERAITPQSKSLTRAARRQAAAPKRRSSARMSAGHGQADQQIDDGRHREGLEAVEGVVLDVPALRGQLEHADRQADRRHLHGDQELRRERPEDRAQAERQHDRGDTPAAA